MVEAGKLMKKKSQFEPGISGHGKINGENQNLKYGIKYDINTVT